MNNHSDIANVNHGGRSGLFKASNSLPLGSAMKSNYEQFDLPTVSHQNGFGSTMLFGVPTFISRITRVFRQFDRHVMSCKYLASAIVKNVQLTAFVKKFASVLKIVKT
jgi:hypothetical protein